jgi:putative phosphoesterase
MPEIGVKKFYRTEWPVGKEKDGSNKYVKIGLISDTHAPGAVKEPPYEVARAFEGVDLILHAGDIYGASCIDWLEKIAPVQAVEYQGHSTFEGDDRVAEMRTVRILGHTVGIMHDIMLPGVAKEIRPGVLEADFPGTMSMAEAVQRIFDDPVDIVVFGHTHESVMEHHDGVLFVNPGSPSLPKQLRKLGTVAILEVTPEDKKAHIVNLSDFS